MIGARGSEPGDLGRIVHEAAEFFEEDVRRSGGLIQIGDMPRIEADEAQMLSLFQNLIGNAWKYRSKESPRINIYAKNNGGRLFARLFLMYPEFRLTADPAGRGIQRGQME